MEQNLPRHRPIAIVGISCRFAGDATNPDKLWEMLSEGRSAWSEIPSSRFNLEGVYHPRAENLGTTNVRGGHFLNEDIGLFDAAFFNLSAETASTLDPQYRLQLESVYEALENAGLPLARVSGSNTSVFAGVCFHDYQDSLVRDTQNLPRFLMTGTGSAMASNRISHFYNFLGPSMTLDTGCSTTLTALHQACQSIHTGDADMSIVSGSNVMVNADNFVAISSLGLLSPDGKSFSFDSRANGYGRGEGVATLILKPLEDALRDGDPIRAIVRQTLLNQDGKTETITSPSQQAQELLIRECYKKANVDFTAIQYFEAHGTGTLTGDPIEVGAIASVFKHGRSPEDPLFIGSVKPNLGHTEPVSGLASVIKVILAMEHGIIPPSIYFEKPNKRLSLDEWNLKVPIKCEEWIPGLDGIRRASVNNFGYGGSNSHVIIEGGSRSRGQNRPRPNIQNGNADTNGHTNGHANGHFDSQTNGLGNGLGNGLSNGLSNGHTNGYTNGHTNDQIPTLKSKLFTISAKDEQTCCTMVSNLKSYLNKKIQVDDGEQFLNNLAYTLAERRSHFPWIATSAAGTVSDLIDVLDADAKFKPVRVTGQPRIGLVFTGQGAQWHAMGRELLGTYPVFKASILEAEAYLKEFGCQWSLYEELQRDAEHSRVSNLQMSTPLCIAVQISLVHLLESWNIIPTAVCSHSSGEMAAAYTAGALSYRSAMAVSYGRSEVTSTITCDGGMLAVGMSRDAAQNILKQVKHGRANVACVNSPSSITVSGDVSAIEEFEALAKEQNLFARRLRVGAAFHSHHMQPMHSPYIEGMKALGVGTEKRAMKNIRYASPTTGTCMSDAAELGSAEHWARSMLQPVLFVDAFREMALDSQTGERLVDCVIEVGPHAALAGPISDILTLPEFRDSGITYLSCLLRNTSALTTMQALASQAMCKGAPVNIRSVNFPGGRQDMHVLTDLPPYPWNHQVRHWSKPRSDKGQHEKQQAPHDLIGSQVDGANMTTPTWRKIIRTSELPWVREHTVQGSIVYPGAGYISMAIEAARQNSSALDESISGYRLRDVDIQQALVIPEGPAGADLYISLRPVSDRTISLRGWREFRISSVGPKSKWVEHCNGFIDVLQKTPEDSDGRPTLPHQVFSNSLKDIEPEDIFSTMRSVGIYHGSTFQNLERIQVSEKQALVVMSIADVLATMPTLHQSQLVLHPTTLDSVFVSAYTAAEGASTGITIAKVPKSIKTLWVSHNINNEVGHKFRAHATIKHEDSRSFQSSISLFDDNDFGTCSLILEGFTCQSLGAAVPRQSEPYKDEICSTMQWDPAFSFMGYSDLKAELSYPRNEEEGSILMDLRRACFHYLNEALQHLTISEVAQLEGHHKKFYAWMFFQAKLAQANELGSESSKWIQDTADEKQALYRSVTAASVNGELVCRVGPHIAAILKNEITPLELMMEDKLLYRYYNNALKFSRANCQLGKIVGHLARENPLVKILEIGGGTGGATRYALKELGNRKLGHGPLAAEYHFTDISSGFFADAKEQFSDWTDIFSCRKLDIEKDPVGQGFETAHYDIIVACQVLHATKHMETTMSNVRSLLKPGGKLLLVETTEDQMDLQFAFGLLPGWWLSDEEERSMSPSLSLPLWDRVLKNTGFSGVEFEVHDCESEELYSFSTMISTADTDRSPLHFAPVVLVSNGAISDVEWLHSLQKLIAAKTGLVIQVFETLSSAKHEVQGKTCIFIGELFGSLLVKPSETEFNDIKAVVLGCKSLLWVTRGATINCENPQAALAIGLLRSLRNEYTERDIVTLDLDPSRPDVHEIDISAITNILISRMQASTPNTEVSRDFEFAERAGIILRPRIYHDIQRNDFISADAVKDPVPEKEKFQQVGRPLKLEVGTPGSLETLVFCDNPSMLQPLEPDFIEVQPEAFGLNFRDVMAAMGRLDETAMGFEFSGVVTQVGAHAASQNYKVGDRVFGVLDGQYGSLARLPWTTAYHMPKGMDFATAASMPIVFATAYISLYDTARLCKGQSVLIHAAAGGVGQAATILSQLVGAEVFVTAGTQEKRDFIHKHYSIPQDHIFSSRNSSFASKIMSLTHGRGVDVILNSLAGHLLQESFNCLASFGHFIEIGKYDLEQNHYLEMVPFSRAVSFSAIDLLAMCRHRRLQIHAALSAISRLWEQKLISAVYPVVSIPLSQIEKGFRQMQAGKHMGKIVITAGPDEIVPVVTRKNSVAIRRDSSYMIVGGMGGIGKALARWMLARGASNLVLLSRSASSRDETKSFIAELEHSHEGSKIKAIDCDISNADDLRLALDICAKQMPPICGVIQAAMVLQDSVLEQMTLVQYEGAVRPKVQGSWNLHEQLGSELEFFIMLSSLAGILGYASQSNYTAGGAYQDALASYRTSRGLPAVSIDLAVVKNIGYVAEHQAVNERLSRRGYQALSEEQVLGAIESSLLRSVPQIMVGINTGPGPQWDPNTRSPMALETRFAPLKYKESRTDGGISESAPQSEDLAAKLASASSLDEAATMITQELSKKLVAIFMLSPEDIQVSKSMSSFGVDSLVAVELRSMVALQAGAEISVFDIIQSPSLQTLADTIAASSIYVKVD